MLVSSISFLVGIGSYKVHFTPLDGTSFKRLRISALSLVTGLLTQETQVERLMSEAQEPWTQGRLVSQLHQKGYRYLPHEFQGGGRGVSYRNDIIC